MPSLEWAFRQDLGSAEKLALVYLCSEASGTGLGSIDRTKLTEALGVKARSVQRIIKNLKDAGFLTEKSEFYVISAAAGAVIGPDGKLKHAADHAPSARRMLDAHDTEPAAERFQDQAFLAEEVADAVADRLNNFEARMGERIDRLVMFHVERTNEPDPLPPDPVKENPLYGTLIDAGVEPPRAYVLSEQDLGNDYDDGPVNGTAGEEYPDSETGRYERVLRILDGPEALISKATLTSWGEIERAENKHTTKGEHDAFLDLYQAIVQCARDNAGRLSIDDFCNIENYKAHRAPWDAPTPPELGDAEIDAEISTMLNEIAGANNPQCTVQPCTEERGEDGVKRYEPLLAYHHRVKAKHQQMLMQKEMGII